MQTPEPTYLHITDAARAIGCCPATLRRLEARGFFTAVRDYNGRRRYSASDVERLRALLSPIAASDRGA